MLEPVAWMNEAQTNTRSLSDATTQSNSASTAEALDISPRHIDVVMTSTLADSRLVLKHKTPDGALISHLRRPVLALSAEQKKQ